ncbi:MAG: P-II family nitrogen regulator, partial [Alphaproteobacteria bacterium]
ANIDAGARTRFADLWHGLFLLAFVALVPWAIHRIPLAALAAMLVYTGFRLASPREFINVFRIGPDQLLIFVATILGVLATDLLVGVGIGIALKFLIHAWNGVPPSSFFKPFLKVSTVDDRTVQIDAGGSAVFSSWIPFRRQILQIGLAQGNDVIVNLAGARVVDSNVMAKLDGLRHDFEQAGLKLEVVGLDSHRSMSAHPHASRRRVLTALRRVTVVAEAALEAGLVRRFRDIGASVYTATPCHGSGRRGTNATDDEFVRIEVIAPPDVADRILDAVLVEFAPDRRVTAWIETVEVLRPERF